MRAQNHAHFLQHVAIVVDPGLVEPDRRVDAAVLERVQRGNGAAQTEIGAAVVTERSSCTQLSERDSDNARRHSENNLNNLTISGKATIGIEVDFYVLKVEKETVKWVQCLVNCFFYRK
jgi:hypothetical protein